MTCATTMRTSGSGVHFQFQPALPGMLSPELKGG